MADVFDFELHETNTGSLDEDSDDVVLDDVRKERKPYYLQTKKYYSPSPSTVSAVI